MSMREWHGVRPRPGGGVDTDIIGRDSPVGGKRKRKATKTRRSRRTGGKVRRAGMGIRAKAPGIMTDKKHSWGKGHKF